MRVIGGEFRSRALKSVPGLDVRPTPDRLREALFNVLAPRIEGAVFADLYAGTGAVGIEALSRGASRAIFVEQNRAAVERAARESEVAGARSARGSAAGTGDRADRRITADIVFLDPPYDLHSEYETALTKLGAIPPELVIVQHDVRLKLAPAYGDAPADARATAGGQLPEFLQPRAMKAPHRRRAV